MTLVFVNISSWSRTQTLYLKIWLSQKIVWLLCFQLFTLLGLISHWLLFFLYDYVFLFSVLVFKMVAFFDD